MATTYGERLLADAEERTKDRRARRRLFMVFAPAALVTILATWATLATRHDALGDAGVLKMLVDHGATLGYAALLVIVPLYLAVTPAINAFAAALAAVMGPVLMPVWFGPGWKPWHRVAVFALCALVIAARRAQPRPEPGRRPRGRRR